MKDKFTFNVCSFVGMFVTLIYVISILKSSGIYISPIKGTMMIAVVFLFAMFADVFYKMLFYILIARIINYPWLWREQRANLTDFAKEDLKEHPLSEIVSVALVLAIGYYLTHIFLSPYVFRVSMRINSVMLCLAALWLGGLIIGGFLYIILNSLTNRRH